MPFRVMCRPGIRVVVAAGVGLTCLLVLYRVQIGSGFARLFGDLLDTRIAVALEQHWLNVLVGKEAWQQPVYFTPSSDVLGYNDGYLLYGLLYSVLRVAGLDPFLANEAVGALFRALGFAGFMVFARQVCRLPFRWALLGAAVFTLSNAVNVQSTHMQLSSVALAPWLALFVWLTWRARSRRGRAGWAFLSALLAVSWLMTAFYTVWFAGLFALVLAIVAAGCFRPRLRRLDWLPLLPAALVLAVGLAAFASTYLPKARETGMHSFSEVLPFLPAVFDLVHVGPGNWLFGWLDAWLTRVRPDPPETFELAVGFAPVLLVLALAGAIMPWFQARSVAVWWWRAAGLAVAVCLLLCLRVGDFSLWRAVFAGVPGAGAVRVVSRLLVSLDFPVVLLAMHGLSRAAQRWPVPFTTALAAILVLEEVNGGAALRLDRPGELAMLRAVPPPPAACARFLATAPRVLPDMFGEVRDSPITINVDAMLLAEMLRLPTFNGHASFLPPHFGFSFHDKAQYAASARDAVLGSGLEAGTCGLNLQSPRWAEHVVALTPLPLGQPMVLGGAATASDYVLDGWSGVEPSGRWTQGDLAEIAFTVTGTPGDLLLTMRASAFPGRGGQASPARVQVNGRFLTEWTPGAAPQTLIVRIPRDVIGPGGAVRLRLVIERPISPFEMGMTPDHRPLGLFVERFQVDDAGLP